MENKFFPNQILDLVKIRPVTVLLWFLCGHISYDTYIRTSCFRISGGISYVNSSVYDPPLIIGWISADKRVSVSLFCMISHVPRFSSCSPFRKTYFADVTSNGFPFVLRTLIQTYFFSPSSNPTFSSNYTTAFLQPFSFAI